MKADLILKNYEIAKERYAALGVDTDKAIATLEKTPISLHCWQGDDVKGFDQDGPLTGGIHIIPGIIILNELISQRS